MATIGVDMASIRGIPYLHGVISTGGGDALSIRGPCHGTHIIGVPMIGEMVGRGDKMHDESDLARYIGKENKGEDDNEYHAENDDHSPARTARWSSEPFIKYRHACFPS